MPDPESFSYSVSNGYAATTATVTVIPIAASTENQPPELTDDTLTVRTGDVGAVAVLANDRSPAGLRMMVTDNLQHEISEDLASVFMSDNVIQLNEQVIKQINELRGAFEEKVDTIKVNLNGKVNLEDF